MTKFEEKRERNRVEYVLGTKFVLETGEVINCIIRDISMGGAFLLTEHPPEAQTTGELKIVLKCGEEKKEIVATCNVLRAVTNHDDPQKNGMAVQIVDIDPDSSIVLYNVVKFQSKESDNY